MNKATPEAGRAAKLVSMGFSQDMAIEAAERHSNVEAAIEWILKQSVQIMQESASTLGRFELRAPTRAAVGQGVPQSPMPAQAQLYHAIGGTPSASQQRTQSGYNSAAGQVSPASPASPPQSTHSSLGSIIAQLRDLGFTNSQASEAARRNSSVEGAVEWLASRGEL